MDHSRIIISVLEHHDIEYWPEGKNVSADSINIKCPFCDDGSNHCGIFKRDLGYHCWRCNSTGTLDYLVAFLTHRPVEECADEIAAFGINFGEDAVEQILTLLHPEPEPEDEESQETIRLPEYFELVTQETTFPLLDYYLEWRNISRQTLIDHQCGICTVGDHMNRLVIPVYFQGELVSYQAADLTGQSDVKYRTAKNEINQFLYRWDMLDPDAGYMILVEGVLDAWRVGGNALATFGTSLTTQQRTLIIQSQYPCIVMCWDGAAWIHAQKEMEQLQPFFSHIGMVRLPQEEDPDSFGFENTWSAINETLEAMLA
jgi:hypothetical protein